MNKYEKLLALGLITQAQYDEAMRLLEVARQAQYKAEKIKQAILDVYDVKEETQASPKAD